MKKEELFNEAMDFKKENPNSSPEELFYDFKSWEKIRKLEETDQVFAFRKIVNIFEIDYKIPLLESAVSDCGEVLDFGIISKWETSFEQSQSDKAKAHKNKGQ